MVKGMDKNEAWDYALGMIKVDGLEPTPEMKIGCMTFAKWTGPEVISEAIPHINS